MSDDCTESVEEETFNWVIIESSEREWDIEPVVDRVEVAVEEARGVEETVEEILPSIDEEAARLDLLSRKRCNSQCKGELSDRDSPPVDPLHNVGSVGTQQLFTCALT